jgi:hypothetical protein
MKGTKLEKIIQSTINNNLDKGHGQLFLVYFKDWNETTNTGKTIYKNWEIPDKEIKNILLKDCKMYKTIGIGKSLNRYLEKIGNKDYQKETIEFNRQILLKYIKKLKKENKKKFKKEHDMDEKQYQEMNFNFEEGAHIPSIYDFNIPFRNGEF